MLYASKKRENTWMEDYVFHYRKAVSNARKDLDAGGRKDVALRALSRCYSSASLMADYCQKHAIALTGGALPTVATLEGTDYKQWTTFLQLDANAILTSYVSNTGKGDTQAILKGDEVATMFQQDHIASALDTVAKDTRGIFKLVAHHHSLMRRMSAFSGNKGPIRRTFTLSIDNDMAISANKIYIRRKWKAVPVKQLTRLDVQVRCAKVGDEAGLLAENIVEQGCYTGQHDINGVMVLWYEASEIRRNAGDLLRRICREIRDQYSKYQGFTGWGRDLDQKEALAIQYAPGIIALSGAPIVSVKTAENADFKLIRALMGTGLASAEVQQIEFAFKSANPASSLQFSDWDMCRDYYTRKIEPNLKKSHENLRKERERLRAVKV